jgi:N-acetyl-beta-hexosaminidase
MMEFCTGAMMYNDPANKTVNTLKRIYTEMVSLFPDAVFHMGGDEPYCVGQCTLESVQRMEAEMARHVVSLGKT